MTERTQAILWGDVEFMEECDFIHFQMETVVPEAVQKYVAGLGGYRSIPAWWQEPIR